MSVLDTKTATTDVDVIKIVTIENPQELLSYSLEKKVQSRKFKEISYHCTSYYINNFILD
jgi:hypothetical protein